MPTSPRPGLAPHPHPMTQPPPGAAAFTLHQGQAEAGVQEMPRVGAGAGRALQEEACDVSRSFNPQRAAAA